MIQILAYRGTSWVSKAIRWQTRSPYSHIAARSTEALWVKRSYGEKLWPANHVIEAWQKGGVSMHESISTVHTPGTKVDIYGFEPQLNSTEVGWFAGYLMQQLGKAYDFHAIFHFLTREPMSHWKKNKWFCSELIFEASLAAGRNLLERCSAWEIPPRDIPRSPLLTYIGQEVTV